MSNHAALAADYLVQARSNPYLRWRPVFAFYAALHAFEHRVGKEYADHATRNGAIRREPEFTRIKRDWFSLNDAAHQARYDASKTSESSAICVQLAAKAEHILTWAGVTLPLPSGNDPPAVGC
jgi:hypothetical protein